KRYSRFQPRDDLHPHFSCSYVSLSRVSVENQRGKDFLLFVIGSQRLREHANNGNQPTIQNNLLSDNPRVAVKPIPPAVVGKHPDPVLASLLFLLSKVAS